MNVFILIMTMAVAAREGTPNYAAAQGASAGAALGGDSVTAFANGTYPPIVHYSALPPSTTGFTGAVNGLMQAVYGEDRFPYTVLHYLSQKRRNSWQTLTCHHVLESVLPH